MSGGGKVVAVTGASGYIASWLVKLLLQRGYTVKASVRDPSYYSYSTFLSTSSIDIPFYQISNFQFWVLIFFFPEMEKGYINPNFFIYFVMFNQYSFVNKNKNKKIHFLVLGFDSCFRKGNIKVQVAVFQTLIEHLSKPTYNSSYKFS